MAEPEAACDLDEIRERLAQAKVGLDRAEQDFRAYVARSFDTRTVPQSDGSTVIQARLTRPLTTPVKVGLSFVIHEARACLDSLACVLAARNGKSASGIAVPAFEIPETFCKAGETQLKKLKSSHRDALLILVSEDVYVTLLNGMHKFDKTRKHRRLGVMSQSASDISFGGGVANGFQVTGDGRLSAEWCEVLRLGAGSAIQVGVSPRMQFLEPDELLGQDAIDATARYVDVIASIVERFSSDEKTLEVLRGPLRY